MSLLPLNEAKSQLQTVNAAIEAIIAGKSIKELRVGSDNFMRMFIYSDTTLQELKDYRAELYQIIDAWEGTTPTFRTNATIPLVSTKGY